MSSRTEEKAKARAERERVEQELAARSTKRRRLGLLAGVLALAALVVVALVLVSGSGGDDTAPAAKGGAADAVSAQGAALFDGVPQQGVTLGDPKAPVTLVELADLQCPFCAQYSAQVLPTLIRDYVKPGKVKMELRLIDIIGADSTRAAKVANGAALQNKSWPFAEVFYLNQGTENSGYVTDDFLREIGAKVPGLDVDAALAAANGPRATALLTEARDIANANGVASTPSFLVGKTGGKLQELKVRQLTPGDFTPKLDELLKQR